ncbi:MAG: DUF805 domain-containing protein [Hyphomicrobiales bacterium]|nr:DUF805 domain-containing protein [Hyphomicrobiales bacterium]
MDVFGFLFSFRGRVNRAKYWLFCLTAAVLLFGASGFIARARALPAVLMIVVSLGVIIVVVAVIVASFAVGIKRLHDRDKSGWWMPFFVFAPSVIGAINAAAGHHGGILFTLLGAAISLWALVELGFLPGTEGTNGYGPDPRFSGGKFASPPPSRPSPPPASSLARVNLDISDPKTFGHRGTTRPA